MRSPHDHDLDYIPNSIYPEVRAIMDRLRHEKPELIFDLHCPGLRSGDSQHVFVVGQADKRLQAGIDRFSAMLAKEAPPVFPTLPEDDVPFGTSWNTDQQYAKGKTIVQWAAELPWQPSAQSMEIPFANTHEITVDANAARHLGAALARTILKYLL